jgi:hypothetical protein
MIPTLQGPEIVVGPLQRTNLQTEHTQPLDTEHYARKVLEFPCNGDTCEAWLYVPKGLGSAKAPVVLMAHGMGGQKVRGATDSNSCLSHQTAAGCCIKPVVIAVSFKLNWQHASFTSYVHCRTLGCTSWRQSLRLRAWQRLYLITGAGEAQEVRGKVVSGTFL